MHEHAVKGVGSADTMKTIQLFQPKMPSQAWYWFKEAIDKGEWTKGNWIKIFEAELARYVGYETVLSCSTGTMAAAILFRHLTSPFMKRNGSDVKRLIVPALSFVSPALEALRCGIKLQICDIDPKTWLLDYNKVSMTPGYEVAAVLGVDYAGFPLPDPKSMMPVTHLIRDAAHYIGPGMGHDAWSFTLFSFHPVKNLLSLGGGGIATNARGDFLRGLERDRDFGRDPMYGSGGYDVVQDGTNGYMTNLSACVARQSLLELGMTNHARRDLAAVYDATMPREYDRPTWTQRPVYHFYPIALPKPEQRYAFVKFMAGEGIEVGWHYPSIWEFKYIKDSYKAEWSLAEAPDIVPRIISLPCHPGMSFGDVGRVVDAATRFLASQP